MDETVSKDDSTPIVVSFPGGLRVDAKLGDRVIGTDQPVKDGGGDSAPAPFELFLAALATCAGYYVLKFCQARDLSMEGIRVVQDVQRDPKTKKIAGVRIDVEVPEDFPDKYRAAVLRAADQCAVKKAIQRPLSIEARLVIAGDG